MTEKTGRRRNLRLTVLLMICGCLFGLSPALAAGPPSNSPEAYTPFEWPIVDPGGSWNVPRIALPSCMGLLPQYESEWWYYVGYAVDDAGESFSLQLQILRSSLYDQSLDLQITGGFAGIGRGSTYIWSQAYGMGVSDSFERPASLVIPPVSNSYFQAALAPWVEIPEASPGVSPEWRFYYVGGAPLGAAGARYGIFVRGNGAVGTADGSGSGTMSYEITADLTDRRGMVMEGISGYVGPDQSKGEHGTASYEYAQPVLDITAGTLCLGDETHRLVGGSLWQDRQVLTKEQDPLAMVKAVVPPDAAANQTIYKSKDTGAFADQLPENLSGVERRAETGNNDELYIGTWMALVLDGGASMVLASFWQKKNKDQWMTGTLVQEPPVNTFGNLYFPVVKRQANGGALIHGVSDQGYDFDVNILWPDLRELSPHWTSPQSGQTYATAWWVRFGNRFADVLPGLPENVYLFALTECTENLMPDVSNAFWEGAARVCADPQGQVVIGHAFVEQMGFKNRSPEPEPATAAVGKSGGPCFFDSIAAPDKQKPGLRP
ncbi:MAG: hypothetical protein AB1921_07275 [Thermodesulfobacteriota bacterium]